MLFRFEWTGLAWPSVASAKKILRCWFASIYSNGQDFSIDVAHSKINAIYTLARLHSLGTGLSACLHRWWECCHASFPVWYNELTQQPLASKAVSKMGSSLKPGTRTKCGHTKEPWILIKPQVYSKSSKMAEAPNLAMLNIRLILGP